MQPALGLGMARGSGAVTCPQVARLSPYPMTDAITEITAAPPPILSSANNSRSRCSPFVNADGKKTCCVGEDDLITEARLARLDSLAFIDTKIDTRRIDVYATEDGEKFRLDPDKRLFALVSQPPTWQRFRTV